MVQIYGKSLTHSMENKGKNKLLGFKILGNVLLIKIFIYSSLLTLLF